MNTPSSSSSESHYEHHPIFSSTLLRKMALKRIADKKVADDSVIEPEKRRVVLFIRKDETLSSGIKTLGNQLGRMPTEEEILKYFQ